MFDAVDQIGKPHALSQNMVEEMVIPTPLLSSSNVGLGILLIVGQGVIEKRLSRLQGYSQETSAEKKEGREPPLLLLLRLVSVMI